MKRLAGGLCLVVLASCTAPPAREAQPQASQSRDPNAIVDPRPNVLMIVTGDGAGSIDTMPATDRFFRAGGTTFTNASAADSCCPAHPPILTGRYAPDAETDPELDARTTLQYYFRQETDYRTGLVGTYSLSSLPAADPPYFHRWWSYPGHGRRFNVDGTISATERDPIEVMARAAQRFIRTSERHDERPWFLYVSPVFSGPRATRSRGLRAVDDLAGKLADTLRRTDEAATTLAFYTATPARPGRGTASTAIPLAVRWPGYFAAGATDDSPVADVDIAATVMRAAGLIPDRRYPLDGRALALEASSSAGG